MALSNNEIVEMVRVMGTAAADVLEREFSTAAPTTLDVASHATVGGNLDITGELDVDDDAEFHGETDFQGPANFVDFNYITVARTATADGTGTGTIAAAGMIQFVAVTSANAAHIIVLPAPTPGTIIILYNGATGYELKTSAPATVALNGGTGAAVSSAIAASQMVLAICTSATSWHALEITGATLTGTEAAA